MEFPPKGKIISGSVPGGVWGCYPGFWNLKYGGKASGRCLEEVSGIPEDSASSRRKKISGSFPGGVWGCYLGSWNVGGKLLGKALEESQMDSRGQELPPREKKNNPRKLPVEGDSTGDNSWFPKSETTFISPRTKPSFRERGMLKAVWCPALRVQVWGCQWVSPRQGPWLWLQMDKAHPPLAPRATGMLGIRHHGSRRGGQRVVFMAWGKRGGPRPHTRGAGAELEGSGRGWDELLPPP